MVHRVDWSEEETLKLLEIWEEDSIQAVLEGCKRNKQVYEGIVREMRAAGYNRTFLQFRNKVQKLRTECKKVKDRNSETGSDRKDFSYYDELDAILLYYYFIVLYYFFILLHIANLLLDSFLRPIK